jgi:uncharacterized protein (TIGR00725 family)
MKTKKIVSLNFHSVTVDNVEVAVRPDLGVIKKPTIAVFGGDVDIPSRINKSLLKALCVSIGEKLGKKKLNILTTGSPGISTWIAKSAAKNGASVWIVLESTKNMGHDNDYGNVVINTNLDHEFVNFFISYIADIGISIDGGIGSLIKAAIMVDYEKPLICMKNTGGAASKLPDLLRESVHNFQDLNLYEVETVNELMKIITRLSEGKVMLQSQLQKVYNQIK